MADKLQGTWVFGDDFTPQFVHNGTSKEWELDFESNGTRFSRLSINCFEFKNNIYNTNTLAGLGYYLPDGTFTRAYLCATDTVIRNPQYMVIYIHSKYAEVENADTLYQALTARATHTPVGEDIKVTMQSAKGVLLKTQDKFCENDILVTPDLEELTVTENGEYTPSKVGYSKVTVNVEATATDDRFKQLVEGTIKEVSDGAVTSIGEYAFSNCRNLASVDMPNVTSIGERAFQNCSMLTSVDFPNVTKIASSVFSSCTALTSIDLQNVTRIESSAFYQCVKLENLILRSETVCKLGNTSAFSGVPFGTGGAGGKLIVPRSLTTEYQNATNWSPVMANNANNRILALEDYTVDGTITGEIDWDKLNGGTTA